VHEPRNFTRVPETRGAQCTMASSANFLTNQSLPFYPKGNVTGAILTLSQARARVR
jgi:hypothetical protein